MKKNKIYRLEDCEVEHMAIRSVRTLAIVFLLTLGYLSAFVFIADMAIMAVVIPGVVSLLIIRALYKFKLKLYKGYRLESLEDSIKQVFEIDKISGMFGYGWTRQKTLYNSQEKYLYFAKIEKLVFKKKGLLLVSKNGNSESIFIPKQITSFDDICVEIKNKTNL